MKNKPNAPYTSAENFAEAIAAQVPQNEIIEKFTFNKEGFMFVTLKD